MALYNIGADWVGDESDEDDELGWDELVGAEDDLDALLGAVPTRRAAARRRVAMVRRGGGARALNVARALKRVEGQQMVREQQPTKARELPIGFDSVSTIAATATSTLTQRPQQLFRPERLIVPSNIAASFLLNDLKVGNVSQLVANGAIPCAAFAENAFGVRLKADTANPAIDLVLTVTNISGGALRFVAAVIGPVVFA